MELNRENIIKALECCHLHSHKHCPECPYNKDTEKACFMLLMEHSLALIISQEQRIKELTEENERLRSEWISVKDKLPKWNGLYLTFQDGKVNINNFDAQKHKFGVWWHYTPDGRYEKNYRFIEADGITHWMPVEAPKGARNEEG